MKQKYEKLIKNIFLFTIGSFGAKLVSFLLLPLYTALISTSDYGTVDLLQSTAQLLMPILLLSIQDATLRFGMDSNYKKEDVLSTSVNVIIKGTIVFLLGIFLINLLGVFEIGIEYWIFLFFTFLLGSLNNCFNLHLKAMNKASVIAIGGILGTFITCTSNVVCLLVLKLGINGYMISSLIGIFFQIIYQIINGKIYKDLHIKKYKNLSKPMLQYSSPLVANSISWWINNASDRYILTLISGLATNGIYAIACKIPSILTTFQSIFYNAWSISAISEFNKNDNDGFIGYNYVLYSFTSLAVCSFVLLINIPLAELLYSKSYFIAWQCVPFLLVSTVFNGIAQFEGSLYAASKKTKEVSLTTFIGALLNIVCNFIFIYFLGAPGAALATLLGYGVTWGLRTIFLQRFVTMKVEWKIHLISLVLLIVQSILATLNMHYSLQVSLFVMIIVFHFQYIKKAFSGLIRKIAK